jgi:hypothetical protein
MTINYHQILQQVRGNFDLDVGIAVAAMAEAAAQARADERAKACETYVEAIKSHIELQKKQGHDEEGTYYQAQAIIALSDLITSIRWKFYIPENDPARQFAPENADG